MRPETEIFRELCHRVIREADAIFEGSKNDDYNSGGIEIIDYFTPIKSMTEAGFVPLHRKFLRLKSLISSGRETQKQNDSLKDTLVDIINYTRFEYACVVFEEALKKLGFLEGFRKGKLRAGQYTLLREEVGLGRPDSNG